MDKQIEFIPVDYDSFDYQGREYVKIFGRTAEGKRACVIDTCDAFFWAVLKEGANEKKIDEIRKKIEKIEVDNAGRNTKVLKTELHKKQFLGKDVEAIKIYITNYKDGHAVADHIDFPEIEKRRGYDINFITHYIIERKVKPLNWYSVSGELLNNSPDFGYIDASLEVDICIKADLFKESSEKEFKPKVLAFDIEADEFEIGKGHILMLSIVGKNIKKVLTWKQCKQADSFVECLKNEAAMISRFVEVMKKEAPDILVGYFSDGFDLPYLRARAEKNGIKLNIGLDNSQPSFARGRIPSGRIRGVIHVDLFRFIETAYSQYMQSETLSLDDVSLEFLGEGKMGFEAKKTEKIKEHEWKDYFDYNLQDSVLTFKLFEKAWPDLLEFSRIIQEPLFDVSRDSMSQNVENYILHNLNRFNEIPEKRPLHDEIQERRGRERYEGAFVLQPVAKLYENLATFDFTSYWPSIIVSFNLSLSTLLDKKEKDSLEVDIGKKIYFSKKPGFFPLMLAEIIKKRKEYKQELKKHETPIIKARSNAFKLLANASYGYQGFFGARYYCPEASAATTSISRDFIKKIIEKTNKNKFLVVQADTDGFSFLLNNNTKDDTLQFLKKLNSELPGMMELELESFYKRGIFVTKRTGEFGAKKKYALIDYEGNIKIRGFETVRRNWCNLAREMQNEVLEKILKEGNADSALELVKRTIKELKERKIDKSEVLIRTQLKKEISEYKAITPHVIAAQKIKEQGLPVDTGMLVEYFIAETRGKKELVREKVKLPDEKGEYNIKYYLEHQLLPAIENIFEVFGINIKEVMDGKKQTKLGQF
ncbi:hypothetical protein HZA33_02085 [Candidatus Pacearchaeota archaeon]|nr:hypothetical protein [Candidatus Pacearchaeota archaeon]